MMTINRKLKIIVAAFLMATCHIVAHAQDTPLIKDVFPRGTIAVSDHFTGTVWSCPLVRTDSVFNYSASNVSFAPGARTRYHKHDEGQILLCTAGNGWYQERGKPAIRLKAGDVVRIPPHVEHWHGTAKDSEFSHLSLIPHQKNGNTLWLEAVSDEDYNKIHNDTKK